MSTVTRWRFALGRLTPVGPAAEPNEPIAFPAAPSALGAMMRDTQRLLERCAVPAVLRGTMT